MKRLSVLALALVVVLAGCSGGGTTTAPPNADGPGTTPTQTPVAVPDDAPPGITASGIDADALVSAHTDALSQRNYTLSVRQRIGDGGLDVTALVGTDRSPALIDLATATANRTTYVGADAVYERRLDAGNQTVRRIDTVSVPTGATYVQQVLDDANFSYNGTVERDGRTLYRVDAHLDDLTRTFSDAEPVYFHGQLLVTESGIVTDLTYDLSIDVNQTRRELSVRATVTDIGATDVPRPDWVERAGNGSTGTTRTLSEPALGTTLSVSGPQANVSAVVLRNASRRFYGSDVVESARVSPLVEAFSPTAVSPNWITMAYDGSAVPDGEDEKLFVFVYHPDYQTFLPMETSYDPENETVRATRILPETTVTVDGETRHPTLDGFTGNYVFVVMHGETYWDAFGNSSA